MAQTAALKDTTAATRLTEAIRLPAANACSIHATPSSKRFADRRSVHVGRLLEQ
jgi:hypothetical protein